VSTPVESLLAQWQWRRSECHSFPEAGVATGGGSSTRLSGVGNAGGGDGNGNTAISVWSWIQNFVIFISILIFIFSFFCTIQLCRLGPYCLFCKFSFFQNLYMLYVIFLYSLLLFLHRYCPFKKVLCVISSALPRITSCLTLKAGYRSM
jgi:magnesium-transporting ATPase (P-type)